MVCLSRCSSALYVENKEFVEELKTKVKITMSREVRDYKDTGLIFRRDNNFNKNDCLYAYANADLAGDPVTLQQDQALCWSAEAKQCVVP